MRRLELGMLCLAKDAGPSVLARLSDLAPRATERDTGGKHLPTTTRLTHIFCE